MSAWSFYFADTGLFSTVRIRGDESFALVNIPDGCLPIPGCYDRLSQRVDVSVEPPDPWPSGSEMDSPAPSEEPWYPPVIDYQPPQPKDDEWKTWTWNDKINRWVSSPTDAALKAIEKEKIQKDIERIEAGQLRSTREALLAIATNKPIPEEVKTKIAEIDSQVAKLRDDLQAVDAVSEEPKP